jgi:UDP-N-acetylmuramoyl-L-alanyl-D-glutamate--2,6-diaminopimelate ligase
VKSIDYTKYSDIVYDSRKVIDNCIFVAIKGLKIDGHEYIKTALELGAKLIVLEQNEYIKKQNDYDKLFQEYKVDFELASDTRLKLAEISNLFYREPSKDLCLIGVTGTNGKTTVTHLIQSLLMDCAILGTMGLRKTQNDQYLDQGNTTPQNKEVQKIIRNIVDEKFKYLAMEVSSHALDQYRVACLNFKYAIVTNLTQDHLDYHKTMDHYYKTKAKIFSQTTEFAILNSDDSYFTKFETEAKKSNLTIIRVSTKNPDAELFATDIKYDFYGLSYKLIAKGYGGIEIKTKLNSEFNIYNSMFAITVALKEGVKLDEIANSFINMHVVPGRFEAIKEDHTPLCIVDYAHSPDGLLNVLRGAKALVQGDTKLICVFGCGGDRDITKRPLMGKIAYDYADKVYVTSDNPRSEDPDRIIADILTGIPDLNKTKVLIDRRTAIQTAIREASIKDIIVIAGKGHENYQILADETIHFDDREEVLEAFKQLAHN